jgi:hypothetical protein
MLELLKNMYQQVREDFPDEFYRTQSFEALDDAVSDMRAYACRRDLDVEEITALGL